MAQIKDNSTILGMCALAAPRGLWCQTFALEELAKLSSCIEIICWTPVLGSHRFRVLGPVGFLVEHTLEVKVQLT